MSEVQGVRGGLGAVVVEVSALGWARWMVRNPFLKVESPEWFRLRCYKRGNTGLTREPGGGQHVTRVWGYREDRREKFALTGAS